ncbi:unnamed protein product [Prorocentrum cordatum]|uniref:Uncharacterized protein n=1 Tax=Prorocentrum cordatum TaxID=2364126 RepID=A0ABN9PRU9_9DINO|nr:unnamed protein product [Polarella glacialis]
MGCGSCRHAPLLGAPSDGMPPPLPSEGPHSMRVVCTGASLRGRPVAQRWNSNAQLLWRVCGSGAAVPEAAADGHGGGGDLAGRDWFYLTTSTDVYHFGVFKDSWARVRAYGSKEVAAETLVQLSEKEKILRFVIFVGGVDELTLIRCGSGAGATVSVEPGTARPGDFTWTVTQREARRNGRLVLVVQPSRDYEYMSLQILEDDSEQRTRGTDRNTPPPVASDLSLAEVGVTERGAQPEAAEAALKKLPPAQGQALAALAEQSVRRGIDYASLGLGWDHPQTRLAYRSAQGGSFTHKARGSRNS